jgi:hypothetical protein
MMKIPEIDIASKMQNGSALLILSNWRLNPWKKIIMSAEQIMSAMLITKTK